MHLWRTNLVVVQISPKMHDNTSLFFGRACFVVDPNSLAPDNRTDAAADLARGSKRKRNVGD